MKIQLIESEIQEALQQYLKNIITISEDKNLNIEILATRGANGVTAEVTIDSVVQNTNAIEVPVVKVEPQSFQKNIEEEKKEEALVAPKKSLFAGMAIK